MKKLTIRETRAALTEIEDLLEQEGELLITRRGRPVARVLPVPPRSLVRHAELRARMERLERPSVELVRSERGERG